MFDFPASPSEGAIYTPAGGPSYVYNAPRWVVQGAVSGAATAVGPTPPASPTDGQLWYYSDAVPTGGQLMIRYNDGAGAVQWVPASPAVVTTQAVPAGAIMDFAGATAPAGWLLCQGQSVTVAAYPNLHAAIGYLHGGSGANFNVPDLGGRVVAGKEATATRLTTAGAGIDGATLGAAGGTQTHTLSQAESAAHDHSITTGGHSHSVNPGLSTMLANAGNQWDFTVVAGTTGASGYTGYTAASTSAAGNLGGATDVRGGSGAHQNTQPTIIMNKIIKT